MIFPSWPVLLYTNPVLGKYLLEGLFRYQATGQYPNKWSVHDLGKGDYIVGRLNAKAFQAPDIPMQLGTTTATTSRCQWKVSRRGTASRVI